MPEESRPSTAFSEFLQQRKSERQQEKHVSHRPPPMPQQSPRQTPRGSPGRNFTQRVQENMSGVGRPMRPPTAGSSRGASPRMGSAGYGPRGGDPYTVLKAHGGGGHRDLALAAQSLADAAQQLAAAGSSGRSTPGDAQSVFMTLNRAANAVSDAARAAAHDGGGATPRGRVETPRSGRAVGGAGYVSRVRPAHGSYHMPAGMAPSTPGRGGEGHGLAGLRPQSSRPSTSVRSQYSPRQPATPAGSAGGASQVLDVEAERGAPRAAASTTHQSCTTFGYTSVPKADELVELGLRVSQQDQGEVGQGRSQGASTGGGRGQGGGSGSWSDYGQPQPQQSAYGSGEGGYGMGAPADREVPEEVYYPTFRAATDHNANPAWAEEGGEPEEIRVPTDEHKFLSGSLKHSHHQIYHISQAARNTLSARGSGGSRSRTSRTGTGAGTGTGTGTGAGVGADGFKVPNRSRPATANSDRDLFRPPRQTLSSWDKYRMLYHHPQSPAGSEGEFLKANFNECVAKLKEKIYTKGAFSITQHFQSLDGDASGVLERLEFFEALRKFNLGPCMTDQVAEMFLNIIDRDMSGGVDYQEFTEALRMGRVPYLPVTGRRRVGPDPELPFGDPRHKVPFAIMHDADRNLMKFDKKINFMYKSLEETFRRFDYDGSGQIDIHEFRRAMRHMNRRQGLNLSPDEVTALFKDADKDMSGEISWGEFVKSFAGGAGKRFIPEFLKPRSMRRSQPGHPWDWPMEHEVDPYKRVPHAYPNAGTPLSSRPPTARPLSRNPHGI